MGHYDKMYIEIGYLLIAGVPWGRSWEGGVPPWGWGVGGGRKVTKNPKCVGNTLSAREKSCGVFFCKKRENSAKMRKTQEFRRIA